MADHSSISQISASLPTGDGRRIPGPRMEALLRSAALGDIVSVLMRAPRHKSLSLETVRTHVLPALLSKQFLIARVRHRSNGSVTAAGVALWASVSDEVDRRLRHTGDRPLRLSEDEWNSGDKLWLIDVVAPSLLAGSILTDLDREVAKGRPMAAQIFSANGKAQIADLKDMLAVYKRQSS